MAPYTKACVLQGILHQNPMDWFGIVVQTGLRPGMCCTHRRSEICSEGARGFLSPRMLVGGFRKWASPRANFVCFYPVLMEGRFLEKNSIAFGKSTSQRIYPEQNTPKIGWKLHKYGLKHALHTLDGHIV